MPKKGKISVQQLIAAQIKDVENKIKTHLETQLRKEEAAEALKERRAALELKIKIKAEEDAKMRLLAVAAAAAAEEEVKNQ